MSNAHKIVQALLLENEERAYFIIYGPSEHFAFVAVSAPGKRIKKYPNDGPVIALKYAVLYNVIRRIWRDATGLKWSSDCGIEGFDKELFDRRASGEKPQPAYEVDLAGNFKRVSPGHQSGSGTV